MKTAASNQALRNLSVNRHCATCKLHSCFIIQNFTDQDCLDLISATKNCLTFEKMSRVISDNISEEGLYILNHGKLKLYKTDRNGQEIIIRFIKPGEIFSFFSDAEGEPSFSVRAIEDSAICYLNKTSLNKIIERYPVFATQLAQSFYHTIVELQNRYFKSTQSHVPAKVADALLMMHEAYGQDEKGILNVKLSREDIAGIATTTKEQVSKALSEFKSEGIIWAKGRKIEITDFGKLRSTALNY